MKSPISVVPRLVGALLSGAFAMSIASPVASVSATDALAQASPKPAAPRPSAIPARNPVPQRKVRGAAQDEAAPAVVAVARPVSTVNRKPQESRLRHVRSWDGDLRDLPQTTVIRRERFEREGPEPQAAALADPAGGLQAAPPEIASSVPDRNAPAPGPIVNFDGLDYLNWGAGHPPDTNGDVGPSHYIQTINSSVGIYSKTGTRLAAFTLDTLMAQGHFGNLCDTDNYGDPVVLYDTFEDRWIITDFAFRLDASGNVVNPPGAFQCFAASKTGDPVSGGWNFYFTQLTDYLNDYPKLGVWTDGIYMSANLFGFSASGAYVGPRVWAYNKAQMYAGAPTVQVVSFNPPAGEFTLIPSNARLQTGTPPPGRPNYFLSTYGYTNALSVYKFHVDWSNTSLSTFTGPDTPTASTSRPNAGVGSAPALGGTSLDTLGLRAMVQNQYSNLAGVESLWVSHTVRRGNTTGFAAPRWYQVNVTGGGVAANLPQAATWDPDAANVMYRFMPSVAVNRNGDLAMGYSTSSSTTRPAIKYAGRLATDPINTFGQTETLLIQGAGAQTGTSRWGDYSAMSLDPDGCTFWFTSLYYAANGANFLTRIGAFSFPGCATVGSGTLSGVVTSAASGSPIPGATVTLGSRSTTTNGSGAYSFFVPAGTYPAMTATAAGFISGAAASVAVVDGVTSTRNFALSPPLPTVSVSDVAVTEGNTGTTNAVFTVSLSAVSGQAVTVSAVTSNGTATSPADYTATGPTTVTIPAGSTTATFTVPVVGDLVDEPIETFTVTLSSPTNATIGDGTGIGTINDDDATPAISISDVAVTEGNTGTTNAVFTVSLSNPSSQAVTVSAVTLNGTAIAPADFTATGPTTVTIPAGSTTATFTVPVVGDLVDEPTETFTVTLSSPTNATINDATGIGTINDDDATPTISISDVAVTEGNTGTTNAVFTVSLSNPSSQAVTVSAVTSNGTAIAPADYTATGPTTVTVPAGSTTATFTVPVVGDLVDEPTETFTVTLSSPTNATIGDGTGIGTINDDDATPAISISDVAVTEGNTGTTNAVFTVSLSNPSSQAVTVSAVTLNGTAIAPADFTATGPTTVTIPAGSTTATFTVPVVGDLVDEPTETFTVTLSSPTNATMFDATGIGTINDDDATPTISISDVAVTEGNTGTTNAVFTVSLSNPSSQAVTVSAVTSNGTATAPADYTATGPTTVTIPAGSATATFTVPVVGDLVDEPTETFSVTLSSPTNATIFDATGIGTINDDDATPTISVSDVAVTEGNSGTTNAVFTVSLSNPSSQAVTVSAVTSNGTATAPADFTATGPTTVTVPAGSTTATFTVPVLGDLVDEPTETFSVTLSSPTNATIFDATGIGTINDDDATPTISVSDVAVTEGNSGTTNAVFTVSLSNPSSQAVTVSAVTSNGTATAPADFTATGPTTVTVPAGSTTATFTVPVLGDLVDEPTETFTVTLSSPTNATINDATGIGTINDDDATPAISISDVAVTEGNTGTTNAVFTVSLSNPSSQAVTVSAVTSNGTAIAPADFTATGPTTVTIPAGSATATFTVPVVGDLVDEPTETFTVTLSSPTNATISDATGLGTINDDDDPPPPAPVINAFTASNVLVNAGGSSTLSWSASGATTLTLNGSPVANPTGSQPVNPAVTTTYTLVATSLGGTTSRQVTIVVNDGGAALGTPTITSPTAGQAVAVTGVGFSWNTVASAAGYDIRVYEGSTGATLFSGSLLGGASTTSLVTLDAGSYRFGVRACSGGFDAAHCGAFATRDFSVAPAAPNGAPTITFPTQGAALNTSTQTLQWTSVTPNPALSGLSYEVLLRNLTAGTPTLQITVPAPATSTIFTMGSSTQYELKVRACQAGCGPWSTPVTFSVALPVVPISAPTISACNVTGGNSLTCSWSAVTNADTYQVLVVQPTGGPGGSALTVAAMQVSATTVTLPIPAGAATVLIAACNGDGCGPNAQASINAGGPNPAASNLGTPMAGTVVNGPQVLFTWNRIPTDVGATTYRLYVQDLSRQSAALDVYTTQNFYAAYFKAEGARYDGLVIANPGLPAQVTGPASGFNVSGLSATAPTMVSPAHNSTVSSGNIQLGWSPVPGATLYEYFVAIQGQGDATVRGVTQGLLAQVPLTGTGGGTIYSGIVRACPAGATCQAGVDANWGPWSNVGGPGVTNFTVIP